MNNLIPKNTIQIREQEDNRNSTTQKDLTGSITLQEHQSFLPNATLSEVYDLDFIMEIYDNFF